MNPDNSVSAWIDLLKAGDSAAARPLWQRYFERLVRLACRRLQGAPRAVADEEDVALSAFKSFCIAAEQGRFPQLADRDDLWALLAVIVERKASNQVRNVKRLKRGGGKVLNEAALAGHETGEGRGLAAIAGMEPTPEYAAQMADAFQQLLAALDDELLSRIAILKMEGHSNAEIADGLDLALRTVERKLALIRRIWEKGETN